ncbi:MAG: LPS-assembly protein LptD [Acidobacteria bacterium]|nr:LPS-assembly protein LptD [Acidobacteriota bacterium]
MGFARIAVPAAFALLLRVAPAPAQTPSAVTGAQIDLGRAVSQSDFSPQVRRRAGKPGEDVVILADRASGTEGQSLIYEGYVDVHFGKFRLQCDRLTLNDATSEVEAVGNVVYDQEGQRITGSRAEFNLRTRRGTIWDAMGYTDRTPDGVTLFFEARKVARTGINTYLIEDGMITACEQTVPPWSFGTRSMELTLNERVRLRAPVFFVRKIPVIWLPYASVPVAKRGRSSGFLLPTLGNSNVRGRSINIPYYQTLGQSADVLLRVDGYTERGIGAGLDFRSRTGERSRFNAGFFTVFDRIFGEPGPKQGGSALYFDAVQYLPGGFVASADVNVVSNFAFRQVFSDSFQQAISPEERTQIYLNNNLASYSFNFLLQSRNVFLPQTQVTIRQLPSFGISGRPRRWSRRWPLYFDFDASMDGLRRTESTLATPSIVQRLDLAPRVTMPLVLGGGFALTPSLALRSTFYSDSADPLDRTRILGESITRRYLEAAVEFRSPGFERVFRRRDGSQRFKHLIEPSVIWRRIAGIEGDFARIIRFDEKDTVANTHELEYGITNRFFTQRPSDEGGASQPHEWLSVRLSQKYFFDPTFGGALVPGDRNQFFPIYSLSGFSFGGSARRFSPLVLAVTARPRTSLFADLRVDFDTRAGIVRNTRLSAGLDHRIISFSQTWFYTRRLLLPQGGLESGTFPGSFLQSSLFVGNREKGFFGGFDLAYDFKAQAASPSASPVHLITSSGRIGYGFCCGSIQIQNTIFKVGLRSENRITFVFTLNGIGSFGTQTAAGRRMFGQ